MSARKSKKDNNSNSVKSFLLVASPPVMVVVTKDKIERLRECNPSKNFTLLLFYLGLIFSCGFAYLSYSGNKMPDLIILVSATVIFCTLFIAELTSYLRKKDLFEKLLDEIKSEEVKILLDWCK